MIRMVLLWISLLLSLLFMLFPHSGEIAFMFSDIVLSKKQFAHDFFEHLILAVLAVVILSYEPKYRMTVVTFLCIQIADVVDYTLTYGDPWGSNKVVTFNTMKCTIFALVMFLDFQKHYVGRTQNN